MLEHDAKVVLIACNSASASAYQHLETEFGNRGTDNGRNRSRCGLCGDRKITIRLVLLGTKRTIDSATYENKAKKNQSKN